MSSNPPPPDDINAQIVTTTQRLFQLTPCKLQIGTIIRDLVRSHCSNIKSNMLIVRPTGGGKSLVYQVAGYLSSMKASGNMDFSKSLTVFQFENHR